MNILTLDFETYYSQEFSLTKVTNEEYVRSPEFEVIGVSVQRNDGEPEWFSGTMAETAEFLATFDWENSLALAHNAAFDASILTWVFGIKPKGWLDTLSMGRALHGTEVGGSLAVLAKHYGVGTKGDEVIMAKGLRRTDFPADQLARYGQYCCNDTAMTYALFQKMSVGFPPIELRLIDLTIRMFSEPRLWLDAGVLESHLTAVQFTKQELMNKMLIEKDQLMSNAQLAKVLEGMGVEVPMKKSPTTGKQTYAFSKTDEGFKALLEHENVIVQAIVAARLGVKSTIEETRTARFIGIAGRGPMPVPLRYYAAHTGRWGGDDKLNLQNLPRNSPLKLAIIPEAGYVILDSDSSQIEARTLAWLAGQDDLVDAFDRGEDVYKIMASAIYGKAVEAITKDERFVGKTTILGAGYGMGAAKFKLQLKNFGVEVELEEAKRIIDTYRTTYPMIVKLWATAGNMLKAILQNQQTSFGRGGLLEVDGSRGIKLPNGLYLRYPNLRLREDEESGKVEVVYDTKKGKAVIPNRIYGGKVIENVCQALARIVIGEQMLAVNKKYPVVMTVHDAIATVVPEAEAETATEYVELCMRLRPSWAPELPLNCESGYGESYGDC
jgi:DNA polymerase I-like protein with 3'-5' exonuclease and polymerase domains